MREHRDTGDLITTPWTAERLDPALICDQATDRLPRPRRWHPSPLTGQRWRWCFLAFTHTDFPCRFTLFDPARHLTGVGVGVRVGVGVEVDVEGGVEAWAGD